MFHHYSKCLILEYLFLYASIIIKIFINNCHNYQILYLKKRLSLVIKLVVSLEYILTQYFFLLEVNYDKSTIGIHFFLISPILAKFLENKD